MVTGHPKEPFCLPVTDVPVLHSFEARMQTLTRCVGPGRSLLQVSSEASYVANQSVKAAQAASDDGKVDRGRGGRTATIKNAPAAIASPHHGGPGDLLGQGLNAWKKETC